MKMIHKHKNLHCTHSNSTQFQEFRPNGPIATTLPYRSETKNRKHRDRLRESNISLGLDRGAKEDWKGSEWKISANWRDRFFGFAIAAAVDSRAFAQILQRLACGDAPTALGHQPLYFAFISLNSTPLSI